MILKINNSNAKENTHQHLNAKNKRKPARKGKTKHGEPPEGTHAPQKPREPHETASPETKTQGFTTCQFTLTSNMLTHISSQKHLSAIL